MADIVTLMKLFRGRAERRRTPAPDTSDWEEVDGINSYAVFMGYLSLAVRGLGILVLTWTTVVLLGGFVSVLRNKDFWCLTGITFLQAAGVFDTSRSARLSSIAVSFRGMYKTVLAVSYSTIRSEACLACLPVNLLVTGIVMLIQALVFIVVILSPTLAVYICGPYIPIWLAVWRLRHRDYQIMNNGGDDADAGSANLAVALDVLYTLVVAQGVLVYYMTMCVVARKVLVDSMVGVYRFPKLVSCSSDAFSSVVWDYLDDTTRGCSKDPSFAGDKNLITYAVTLMKSEESAHENLQGARVLDTLVQRLQTLHCDLRSVEKWEALMERHVLLKLMVGGETAVMRRLLQMLDRRAPCGREARRLAARIVAHLAADVHLERFPGAVRWVASLLDTLEEYSLLEPYQRDWLLHTYERSEATAPPPPLTTPASDSDDNNLEDDRVTTLEGGYRELVLQGLRILRGLAASEDNCLIILSDTRCRLLSKIIAPVTNDLLHSHRQQLQGGGHDQWCLSLVEGSLGVISRLTAVQGETGAKLRSEISGNTEAVTAMERILECGKCGKRLHEKAMEVLGKLYASSAATAPSSGSMSPTSKESFIKLLLGIFLKERSLMDENIYRSMETYDGREPLPVPLWVKEADFTDAQYQGLMLRELNKADRRARGTHRHYLAQIVIAEAEKKLDLRQMMSEAEKELDLRQTAAGALMSEAEKKPNLRQTEAGALMGEAEKKLDLRQTAAGALMRLSLMESSAMIILKVNDEIAVLLTMLLLNAAEVKMAYLRAAAAVVLERLCIHYTNDDGYLKNLKEALIDATPKVLGEILHSAQQTQKDTETKQVGSSAPDTTDIENQCAADESNAVGVDEDSKDIKVVVTQGLRRQKLQDNENYLKQFIPASLSLCVTVCDTCISTDQDLSRHFNGIINLSDDTAPSVPKLIRNMVERHSHPTGYCLRILKLISRMVISMMKHGGRYDKEDLDDLMEPLSSACSKLSLLDDSMVFASIEDDGALTALGSLLNHGTEKPRKSLRCLVTEAQDLVEKKKAEVQEIQ